MRSDVACVLQALLDIESILRVVAPLPQLFPGPETVGDDLPSVVGAAGARLALTQRLDGDVDAASALAEEETAGAAGFL